MKTLFLIILLGLSFNSYSHNNGSEHVHNRNVYGSNYYHSNYHDREWCPTDYGHYHGYEYFYNAHYVTIVIKKRNHRTYRDRNRNRHRPKINRLRPQYHRHNRPNRFHRTNICVDVDYLSVCVRN